MIQARGTTTINPIRKGRPDNRYQKQVGLLIADTLNRIYESAQNHMVGKARIVVGLPYEATEQKSIITRLIRKMERVQSCDVVTQAAGTLVDLDMNTGMVVSIGQGTTEIVIIEDNKVIDGESSEWASEFITRKIAKFAHFDVDTLQKHKTTCSKYAKILAENLALEITDMASAQGRKYKIVLSGGGILIPYVRSEITSRLKGFDITVPNDPVMSNASGLYKLVV